MEIGKVGLMLLSLVFMLSTVHARLHPLQNIVTKGFIRTEEDKTTQGSLEKVQGEVGQKRVKSVIKKGAVGGGARGGGGGFSASKGGYSSSGGGSMGSHGATSNSKASEGSTTAPQFGGVPSTTLTGQYNQGKSSVPSSGNGGGKQNKNGANTKLVDLHLWIFASFTTLCFVFLSS